MELKREEKILLECLRANGDEINSLGLDRISSADWDLVIQKSIRHSVSPLLYRSLKKLRSEVSIPAEVLKRLHEIYLQSVARNMRLYHDLSKRLKILENYNIPVIILKGAHLSELVYKNIGFRSMSDVDLLIRREDLARVQERLMEAGYSPIDNRLPLDLHWNIDLSIANLNIDIEEIWEKARPDIIAGVKVLVLSPEDLLLHLCTHQSFHHLFDFAGLRTFCDIRETIRQYQDKMDWEQVRSRSKEWGASNAVFLTLLLARDMVGAQVPKAFITALKPDESDVRARKWAIEQIFLEASDEHSYSPYFWELWKPGPFRDKLATFLKLLFPSREFVSQKYPAPFGSKKNYFYYLVRFKDHLIRYTSVFWRILIRDERTLRLVNKQKQNIAMREWLSSE